MRSFLSVLLLGLATHAQTVTVTEFRNTHSKPAHSFWTVETSVSAALLAGLSAADAITTQRGLNMGLREENPIMRPFVTRGAAGQAAGTTLGFGTAIGSLYLLHSTHHYKAQRVLMRLMLAGQTGFVVNNIVAIR